MRASFLKRIAMSLTLLWGMAFFLTPLSVSAEGLVPCGRGNDAACTLCHIVIGVQGIIQWGFSVMTFIAVAIIAAMGIVYIVSAGDSGMIELAKKGIKMALWGFALMLSGWLIVNVVMYTIAKKNLGISQAENWYTFKCDTASKVNETPSGGGGGDGGGGGGGSCKLITDNSNPCSVDNLKKTCFSDVAEKMSQICNMESGGNPMANSGTDHCPVMGPSVSGGLFQINTTVHGSGCGEGLHVANPPLRHVAHYANGWGDPDCKIISESTRVTCMNQTHTPGWNIETACKIYKAQGIGAWGYSANKCNLK